MSWCLDTWNSSTYYNKRRNWSSKISLDFVLFPVSTFEWNICYRCVMLEEMAACNERKNICEHTSDTWVVIYHITVRRMFSIQSGAWFRMREEKSWQKKEEKKSKRFDVDVKREIYNPKKKKIKFQTFISIATFLSRFGFRNQKKIFQNFVDRNEEHPSSLDLFYNKYTYWRSYLHLTVFVSYY